MPLKTTRSSTRRRGHDPTPEPNLFEASGAFQKIAAAAVLSFLKDTRGALRWNVRDLRKTLNISDAETTQVIAILQLQGYAAPEGGSGDWLTTQNGNIVSGSKEPRFAREKVLHAISELRERMQAVNKDSGAAYRVLSAVAYGDFLSGRERVQAADVGIELAPRTSMKSIRISARENAAQQAFLRLLRNKDPRLVLHLYEKWMSARSHRKLL